MSSYKFTQEETIKGKRCLLVGLFSMKEDGIDTKINDVTALVEEKGALVVGRLIQRRGVSRSKKPGGSKNMNMPMSAATFIGQGKAKELEALVISENAEIVVFLNILSGTQKRNLSEQTGCKILECMVA